ncbi:lysophospholipid acyltransferase family protein [Carboxylicivirga linearis]|uniref:Lysophospholipid acyltransferase family protein n=1 Tax=Carboxylicivirga linearis TaxID=1628157 RepID=A0ABS5JY45_9BACT|nr:lysophospholipid acyltransferase family protein [Carboxylicivirga linearis]MBS2099769.1 lysophospholipid acyltransferase family protein [Carboxylicivirga linearis]
MKAFFTNIFIGILWVGSLLPMRVLYVFADFYYILIRLVGYRRKVIEENLKYSFPEKSFKEIKKIRNKFYRHFCDLFVETTKIQTMSEAEMKKRVKYNNLEFIDKAYDEGKDVVAVMAHYNNWEWVPSINLHCKALGCDVYRPLKNKQFDAYMLKLRERWGNKNFTMKATLKEVVKLKKANQRFILGLIADQSPGRKEIQYWTSFLNQNTPVLTGPEKIAKLTKSPVVYLDMQKVKRGYYEVNIVPMVEDSEVSSGHEITDKYIQYLEQVIIKKPENWLWSHRRWKYVNERRIN